MANRKTTSNKSPPDRSAAQTSSRSTVSGPAQDDLASAGNALTTKMKGTQALVKAVPFNANKPAEYGESARIPQVGQSVEPTDALVGASTITETTASGKAGDGAPTPGLNPTNGPLDRVRVDSGGQVLTTNQGVPVADNQNSLKAGLRGPAWELSPLLKLRAGVVSAAGMV